MNNKLRGVLLPSVKQYASKYKIDEKLFDSIIQVESDYRLFAVKFEPNSTEKVAPEKFATANNTTTITELTLQHVSWGLCQIMGFKARENGFSGPLPSLCDLEINLDLGAKIIAGLAAKYTKVEDLIASYNAGSPKKDEHGKYINQDYVDKVLKRMKVETV